MSEDRIGDLEKKVDSLEYKEIAPLRETVNDIKIQMAQNNLLTQQATETNNKLSDTMSVMRDSMIELATSMKASNKVSEELADNVKTLSEQVVTLDNKVETKFQEVDNKSKIDFLQWIKKNWLSCFLGLGALIYVITQMIK